MNIDNIKIAPLFIVFSFRECLRIPSTPIVYDSRQLLAPLKTISELSHKGQVIDESQNFSAPLTHLQIC